MSFAPVAPVHRANAPVHPGHSFFNGDKDLQNSAPVAPIAPVKNGKGGSKSATIPELFGGTCPRVAPVPWGYKWGYRVQIRNPVSI